MFWISSMGDSPLLHGLGEVFPFPVRNGKEHRHNEGGEQLQVVGVDAAQAYHGLDHHIVDDGADGHGQQLQAEVAEECTN